MRQLISAVTPFEAGQDAEAGAGEVSEALWAVPVGAAAGGRIGQWIQQGAAFEAMLHYGIFDF